jgi:hypothetical protein
MSNKINKTAYPQGYSVDYIESYDINKWVKTLETMYLYANQGYDISKTREQLTQNWDSMEKNDFNHWVKYYQGNNQNSYKTAQFLPGMVDSNYLAVAPGVIAPNKPPALNELKPNIKLPEEDDPQFKINKKIKSIISRLMSAEKLATDPDVQRELSKRLDVGIHKWLEELQRVKRLVQVAPIKHASSTILEDLIIKEANILAHKGFPKTARELIKIAQDPVPPPPPLEPGMDAVPPPPGITPLPPGPGGPPAEPAKDPLAEVSKSLLGSGFGDQNAIDDENSDDNFAIQVEEFDPDFNDIVDMLEGTDPISENMVVMAQALDPLAAPAPEPALAPSPELSPVPAAGTVPAKPIAVPKAEIEIVDEPQESADTLVHKKTDDLLENALSGITITDVIERLDTLVNLFRTREIPRQLAIIDLMMDQLNLSSFFPGLAEASSKSLESNQYALTRIEEVLSKLKGSIKNPKEQELDLLGKETSTSPSAVDLEGVRSSLEDQENKEKARKQQRKLDEQTKVEKPVIEVEEDLAQPVNLPTSPAAPAAPVSTKPTTAI